MNRAGARAEELCAELLRRAGLRVLARNWRCRHGEIDLVAEEGRTLVFAEVRYRRDQRYGGAAEGSPARGRARAPPAARAPPPPPVPGAAPGRGMQVRRAAARCARGEPRAVDP